ncbi:MAG: energy transducer TonB [Bacteroidia bacterium]|nr:energy transducer TonB [Bacteroidia bacterium]
MNLFNTFKNNLDEVVFEQRNKAYGAYAIRKAYPDHVNRSMLLTLAPMLFIVAGSILWNYIRPVPPHLLNALSPNGLVKPFDERLVVLTDFIFKMPAKASSVPVYQIKKDNLVHPKIERSYPLKTRAGIDNGEQAGILITGMPGIGALPNLPGGEHLVRELTFSVVNYVENMPEYPGGQDEMFEFIRQNIQYPKYALENNVGGKILLSFVIMPDGSIQMAKIEKGIGFGCDDEALRVLKAMPLWIAGSQNGNKVAVRLILPIKFQTPY